MLKLKSALAYPSKPSMQSAVGMVACGPFKLLNTYLLFVEVYTFEGSVDVNDLR